jgi:hypothetical protein
MPGSSEAGSEREIPSHDQDLFAVSTLALALKKYIDNDLTL